MDVSNRNIATRNEAFRMEASASRSAVGNSKMMKLYEPTLVESSRIRTVNHAKSCLSEKGDFAKPANAKATSAKAVKVRRKKKSQGAFQRGEGLSSASRIK